MSNLKDTDIDDLFRRASDKYPLRTDSSDWDRMAAALEKDPPPTPPYDLDETDNRRKRRFFWLFLLLPLAGAGYLFLHHPGNGHSAGDVATIQSATTPSATTPPATAQEPASQKAASNPTAPVAQSKTADPSTAQNKTTEPNIPQSKTTHPQTTQTPTSDAKTPTTTSAATPPIALAPSAGQAGAGMPHKAHRMANSSDPKGQGKGMRSAGGDIPVRPESTTTTTKTKSKNGKNHFADDNLTNTEPVANTNISSAFSLHATNINGHLAPTTNPYYLSVDVKAPTPKTQDTTKKPTSTKKRSSYLYAGILGAPDLSTVHFQKTTGTGSTFTLLLGYAINSRWAIETGVSIDRKRYYTNGEYFDTTKVRMPRYSYLENVDGTCYMWEIPLNVRYNFNPDGKTKWFATAGLSTYLMTREKYKYQYGWTTWPGTADSSWDIKTPSQYPFSVINLSVGFEKRLGKIGNLRIEPYARIPLSGVGTGKLPILSTGVNIGFTRRLW